MTEQKAASSHPRRVVGVQFHGPRWSVQIGIAIRGWSSGWAAGPRWSRETCLRVWSTKRIFLSVLDARGASYYNPRRGRSLEFFTWGYLAARALEPGRRWKIGDSRAAVR